MDTKSRILAAALELFGSRGYRATSMREIAERVGLTKATLYHHFSAKSEILQSLLEPLLTRLDAAVDSAQGQADSREALLVGAADAMLDHRELLALLLRDTSVYADEVDLATRFLGWTNRATDLLSGPGADWRHRVRAAQALAAIADPVALSMDVPTAELREELLRGGRALLGTAQTAH